MLKNIYSMCMALSLLFGIFPLIALVVANVFGYVNDCGLITSSEVTACYDSVLISTLFSISVYWVITLPIGIISLGAFYFLYLTVRHK